MAEATFKAILNDPTQSKKNIEILKNIPSTQADTTKYRAYTCVGVYHGMMMEHDSSLNYFHKAKVLVQPNSIQMARTNQKIAIVKRQQGKFQEALSMLSEALPIAEKANDKITTATILSEMACNYNLLYNREAAIKHLIKSIEVIEKMPEPNRIQLALQKLNLANFYSHNGNFKLSENLYVETIALFKKLNLKQSIALSLLNYGEHLLIVGKYDEAEKTLLEARAQLQKLGNQELVAIAYLNVALVNNAKQAEDLLIQSDFLKALEIAKEVKSTRTLEIANNYLQFLNEKGKYQQSLTLGVEYATYTATANINVLNIYHKLMGEAYEASGDYKNASKHFSLYGYFGDSILKAEKELIVSQIHENYAHELQQKESEKLAQEFQILEQKSKIKLFLFLAIGAVLISVSIYLWSNMRKVKYKNELLTLKIEVENAQLNQVQTELENERTLLKIKEEIIKNQKKELYILSKQGTAIVEQLHPILKDHQAESNQKNATSIKEAISNQFWSQFSQRFQSVFPGFYHSVQTKFGDIFTQEDLQHLALHKLDLSVSEIAYSLSISALQAELTRKNIIKKCACDNDEKYKILLQSMD
ncbi:MAG: tetratricopeptide repeat protein [Bacteroidota bacterium]|nr:tetratricopeptide repeat protein [Bacteroidota bacterium]